MVLRHQFVLYRDVKGSCNSTTCVVIIDFSENYTCGDNRAVQSSHFGASNAQISLHTGAVYFACSSVSFCSISDCTRHDPAAIWAHLDPVLNFICKDFPEVSNIHFWSDGPMTQYRNKNNFYLFSVMISKIGFRYATWNMFEAGHGKGAADAVGGVLKRTADRSVDFGSNITNADDFLRILSKKTTVRLFLVKEEDITAIATSLPGALKPIPGTMKLHQIQILAE